MTWYRLKYSSNWFDDSLGLKEAYSVSFENFYLVMFYGNQII
jgi:hypothetical protein